MFMEFMFVSFVWSFSIFPGVHGRWIYIHCSSWSTRRNEQQWACNVEEYISSVNFASNGYGRRLVYFLSRMIFIICYCNPSVYYFGIRIALFSVNFLWEFYNMCILMVKMRVRMEYSRRLFLFCAGIRLISVFCGIHGRNINILKHIYHCPEGKVVRVSVGSVFISMISEEVYLHCLPIATVISAHFKMLYRNGLFGWFTYTTYC